MPEVFVSHASDEDELARRFIRRLEERVDSRIWLRGDWTVPTGERWDQTIRKLMQTCDAAVIICSAAALRSHWVLTETDTLVARAMAKTGFRVFPVRIDPVTQAELDASPLRAHGLSDFESLPVTEADLEAAVDTLAAQLNVLSVFDGSERPLGAWEKEIAGIVQEAVREVRRVMDLRAMLEKVDDAQWADAIGLQSRLFARALMECTDKKKRRSVIKALRIEIRKPEDREILMKLLIAARIGAEEVVALQEILHRPRGRDRAIQLGAHNPRTGHFWINRATGGLPLWLRVECVRSKSSDPAGQAFEDACAGFVGVFNTNVPAEIQPLICEAEEEGEPVFVVLPVRDVDHERLQRILKRFHAELDAAAVLVVTRHQVQEFDPRIDVDKAREIEMVYDYRTGVL